MSGARYEVREGSQSCHCCFEATVVDMTKPTMIAGEHWRSSGDGELQYDSVCECFDLEEARLISNALNLLEMATLRPRAEEG